MSIRACVLFLLLCLTATSVEARLGDSPEQTDRRYGQPVAGSGEAGRLTSTRTYSVSGLQVTCGYVEGKVVMESYTRDDRPFNSAEVEALLRTNGGKKGGWTTPPGGYVNGDYKRADGATGTLADTKLTLQTPAWADALAKDEAAAKAAKDQATAAGTNAPPQAPTETNNTPADTNTAPAASTNAP